MKKLILKNPILLFVIGILFAVVIAVLNRKVMFTPYTIDGFYSQMMHFQNGAEPSLLRYVHFFRYVVAYLFLKTNTLQIGPVLQVLIIASLFAPPLYIISKTIVEFKRITFIKIALLVLLFCLLFPACILVISHRSTLCMIGITYLYTAMFYARSKTSFTILISLSLLLCNLSSGAVLGYIGSLIVFYKFVKSNTNIAHYIICLLIAVASISISLHSKIKYYKNTVECKTSTGLDCDEYDQEFVEFYTSRSKFSESLKSKQLIQFLKFAVLLGLIILIILFEYVLPFKGFFTWSRLWSYNYGLFFLIGLPLACVEGLGLMSYAYAAVIYLYTKSSSMTLKIT